jgi:hypothetical protein
MGTRSATATISLKLESSINNLLDDGSQASSGIGGQIINLSLDNGINTDQANRAWLIQGLSLLSGNFRDIDVCTFGSTNIGAGLGKDALGQAMDIEEIVCLVIKCVTGPGELQIMATVPAAAPIAWIPGAYATQATKGGLKAGGVRMWLESDGNGLDVGVGVSNVLRLSAVGGDITADILLIGRHDDDESSSSSASSSSASSVST